MGRALKRSWDCSHRRTARNHDEPKGSPDGLSRSGFLPLRAYTAVATQHLHPPRIFVENSPYAWHVRGALRHGRLKPCDSAAVLRTPNVTFVRSRDHTWPDMCDRGHEWSSAMRAVTSDKHTGDPAESFLRVLDQFASLHNFSERRPLLSAAIACWRHPAQDAQSLQAQLRAPRCRPPGGPRRAHALDRLPLRALHWRSWACRARRSGQLPVLDRIRRRRAIVDGASRLCAERAPS